jgi:DMSO/TMAO reductase YedYZ molybdopterin-dependent catalytic subunit
MAEMARRDALAVLALGGAGALATPLWAADTAPDPALTTAFPEKGPMLLRRTRAPLLETPMAVFDASDFTPNDRFFVRWHYSDIPTSVDIDTFRLKITGAVRSPLALSIRDLLQMPRVELAAVNQCAGNSRGLFSPKVPGAQWHNGAIGNARWTGVRLKDVLDRAGIAPGAVAVRMSGLDRPPPDAPPFAKSISIDHARDGEVMIAFAMNGQQLPMLNGFPIRMIVPGWFSTYWVKGLDSLEILSAPDDNFWMAKAYQIPATPDAGIVPGTADFPKAPITTMPPRSFFTNLADGVRLAAGMRFVARGIAMGGDAGVARVDLSIDGGRHWHPAALGEDHGKYSFRRWQQTIVPPPRGHYRLAVRCTNTHGETQRVVPIWNPGGYRRNPIETIAVEVA